MWISQCLSVHIQQFVIRATGCCMLNRGGKTLLRIIAQCKVWHLVPLMFLYMYYYYCGGSQHDLSDNRWIVIQCQVDCHTIFLYFMSSSAAANIITSMKLHFVLAQAHPTNAFILLDIIKT